MRKITSFVLLFLLAGVVEAAHFVGRITKVATRTFTVSRGRESKEFVVTSSTAIQREGKRTELRALHLGDEVRVVFRVENGRAVAEEVTVAGGEEKDRPHARE